MLSAGVAHVLQLHASVDGFVRLGYLLPFVTLGGQDALAGGCPGVPDLLRARLQRRYH